MRFATAILGLGLLGMFWLCGQATAEEMMALPADGDRAVVYTHRFKPQDFEAGKTLVIEGFGKAMEEHGKERLTFFLVHDDASEVVAVSIFLNGASVEDWHKAMARHEVLEQLEPLRRQPIILQEFDVESAHIVGP